MIAGRVAYRAAEHAAKECADIVLDGLRPIDELAAEISPETITEADGDWVFYSNYGAQDAQAEVVGGPPWANLEAVKNGKAVAVSDETWFLGLGPTGAMRVLDDLERLLTGN